MAPKDAAGPAKPAAPLLPPGGIAFVLSTAAFTAYAFVPSALAAHLLAIFGRTGIDPATVVLIGALFGPAQVAARVTELAFGRDIHPLTSGARRSLLLVGAFRAAGAVRDFAAARGAHSRSCSAPPTA